MYKIGIPFYALFKKFEQARNYQKIYATRILRREGYHQQWKPHALVNSTRVKAFDISIENDGKTVETEHQAKKLDFNDQDLEYFLYHKPPLGYITHENPSTGVSFESMADINTKEMNDEQLLIDCLNFSFEEELERGYELSSDGYCGKQLYSCLKQREKHYKDYAAKEGTTITDENNLLRLKDSDKKLNMFLALPEENPRSEYIQYGGRYLSDFVDFKHARTRRSHMDKNRLNPSMIANDAKRAAVKLDENTDEQQLLAKNVKQSVDNKMSVKTDNAVLSTIDTNTDLMETEFDESLQVKEYRKTEGYAWNTRFRWFKGGKGIGISPQDNVQQIGSIDFDDKIKERSFSEMEYPTLREEEMVTYKRELVDLRDDINNTRHSSWFKLKRGFPEKIEMRYIYQLHALSFKRAWQQIKNDYRYVFKQGGGEILRQDSPPQISIMEFTAEDQLQTALGSFGINHTLFSDWFVVSDNKREACDRSHVTADIVDDRMIFKGFLMHSGIEMGHRTRNFCKDWVGFANVVSNEFDPEWDLGRYHSIGIKLRTDGRPYFLGLECLNRNKFFLFNGLIQLPATPKGEWDYYEIPLHHFRPFSNGEFVSGESWHKVRYVRSIGIQAVGSIGEFHLEVQWIRAFRDDARFDLEDEEIVFIQDLDGMGLYERDLLNIHVIQHQFFSDMFPDPFRLEDNGVFDDFQYLGPPRSQREHFSKLDVNLLKYIDLPDDIPLHHLSEDDQRELLALDNNEMLMLESYVNDRMIGKTKAVQHLYKHDNEAIETVTNDLLISQLKREVASKGSIFFKLKKEYTRPPFRFQDFTQISAAALESVTQKRRSLLRELIPRHLRERDSNTRWPKLF